ncbi:Splicing factor u2af large, partial [Globisporangium splendens]
MAGRGRELTLPAWMKKQQQQAPPPAPPSHFHHPPVSTIGLHQYQQLQQQQQQHFHTPPTASVVPQQFADAPEQANGADRNGESKHDVKKEDAGREKSSSRRSRSRDRRDRSSSRGSSRRKDRSRRSSKSRSSKDHSSPRDKDRSRSRDRRDRRRSHDRSDRRRSRRSYSRSHSRSRERIVRRRKKSYFDVRPPGVTEENAAAYAAQAILQQNMAALSGAVGPASFGPPPPIAPPAHAIVPGVVASHTFGGNSQQTRHARRIYVGGIGDVNEAEISEFFNDVIDRALGERQEGGAVVSVYINRERHFAFVELRSIELTTACMNLDGVSFRGQPLKIRRPNDYNPSTVPKDLGPIPTLNLAALGIVSTTVSDGPGKVFIGGLPYHLNDEQVKELLQAFGPLKSFHLVKELNSNLSKGYGFCEYVDINVTDSACLGLNDMKLGDKTLTVRRAMSQENAKAVASAAGTVNSGLEMGLNPSHAALQAMNLAGFGIPSMPLGTPSRVIVLLNMVTPEELEDEEEYADIVDDIKGECERFGRVNSIVLPRPRDGFYSAVGKVFVEYGDVPSAQAAAAELHGRGFSNRTVAVEYMDEHKYARRDFS